MGKVLMKGNEAIGEAAIRAGCLNYFAYPITPQSEVAEYLARRMPEVGGVFLQGESEVAVGYMIFGAAGCGARVFTTSSSPGISLMSEAISYITCAQCPAVFVNIMRGGPGWAASCPPRATISRPPKAAGTAITVCWSWRRPVCRKPWKWSWRPFRWRKNTVTR
jgi:2-oxoglutarate ferredoxin oxidoreductase subunit alpha